jgi:ArsR family transcriptional regulator, arsenate/arsenite/antimonite-responsive transcriptional repressor
MRDSFFKAIADPKRRRILDLLRKNGTMAAGEIARHFEISLPALSEHLKVLRGADLVTIRKHRQFVLYTLNTTVFEDVAGWIADMLDFKEDKNVPDK